MQKINAPDRQRTIYLDGVAGILPQIPIDPDRLALLAQQAMRPESWAYIAGGAGQERTMRANSADFDQWRIIPRMLRNVEHRDASLNFFGSPIPAPLFLAPIGVLEMVHPEADLAVARAAAYGSAVCFFQPGIGAYGNLCRRYGGFPTVFSTVLEPIRRPGH